MNKMKLFEAIDLIDDDLIREADISSETSPNHASEEESAITVSGVEVHSGIRWQRIAALASAFILIAGFGAVGGLLHKHRPTRHIEPSEIVIPPATESTTVAEDQLSENTETATTNTKETAKAEEKETKESTNTAPTTKANEEEKPAPVTSPADNDEKPIAAEDNTAGEKPDEPVGTVPASTTQKPVTTAKTTTTAVKTTAPKVTEAPTTTEVWQIHLPCTKVSNIVWYQYECPEMFEILRSITYTPDDDRGMCNTYLIDEDDNNRIYALNFEDKWVMKFGQDGTDWGYAPMPDRLYELFCGS